VTVLSVVTNLAIGVVVGVLVMSIWHAWTSGMTMISTAHTAICPDGHKRKVGGPESSFVGHLAS
jgi:hypothetical protein